MLLIVPVNVTHSVPMGPGAVAGQAAMEVAVGVNVSGLESAMLIGTEGALLGDYEVDTHKSKKDERTEIIANSKQNQIVQNRIQAAVISIIQATTFEKMIHVVTHELPELLDVDFITLAIEANADAPKRLPVRGVYVLAPGAIDARFTAWTAIETGSTIAASS